MEKFKNIFKGEPEETEESGIIDEVTISKNIFEVFKYFA